MKVLSSREEYLYKTILDALYLKQTSDGRIVFDIMLSGIPERYESDEVTKAISRVCDCVYDVLDATQTTDLNQVKKLVSRKIFSSS